MISPLYAHAPIADERHLLRRQFGDAQGGAGRERGSHLLDPPFNSNRSYEVFWGDTQEKRAFEDRFGDAQAYIAYMRPRIVALYRVLKKTGSFYYHCDWHASHYMKVMLDQVFSFNNFQNEIIWHRRWRSSSKKFQRLHDTICFYTKSREYTFNPQLIPYTKGSVARKTGGILHRFKKGGAPVLVSDKALQNEGVPKNDAWQIPFIAPSAKERLAYPTQKPLALLEKIITLSSNKGDVVLDAFCGCGTALVAAQKRHWSRRRSWGASGLASISRRQRAG